MTRGPQLLQVVLGEEQEVRQRLEGFQGDGGKVTTPVVGAEDRPTWVTASYYRGHPGHQSEGYSCLGKEECH